MAIETAPTRADDFVPPHPGSAEMPRWTAGTLSDAPEFTWKNWAAMIGPGLVAGAAAIGGGEWLLGPEVTARYGGTVMWLATLSILGQVLYNLEISRYTLYSGEPIFTGKFRCLPGPRFWVVAYLILDFGSVFPYLAANAATPVAAMWLQRIPSPETNNSDFWLMKGLAYAIFILSMFPLLIGGKVYNSIKAVMGLKLVAVLGFLLYLGVFYSSGRTWAEVFSGFVKFGSVPVRASEDKNGNGVLDPGEDWDGDGHLDGIEERLKPTVDTNNDGTPEAWADVNGDGKPDKFVDTDADGHCDGDNSDNFFLAWWQGRSLPIPDLTLIASLAAFAAIAGQGGLSNTPISNYTRDQGWGMGEHVGAIPSVFGGHHITLSHVGQVFRVSPESLLRWRRWYKHVLRDQLVIWMPACFFGLALPSMLSVEYLSRGTEVGSWTVATMTADGVAERITTDTGSEQRGRVFWYLTLFCGFLALGPTMTTTADGVVRRWVDVFWTASPRLQQLDTRAIRTVYFRVLVVWMALGLVMLMFNPKQLVLIATQILNFALGFSCWHTLVLNMTLLPKELRPGWFARIGLVLAGLFFTALTTITTLSKLGYLP